jgi:glutamate decarboxylase
MLGNRSAGSAAKYPRSSVMNQCVDKNMIDKDEYPQTAEFEQRCVNILADLWHAPDPSDVIGCSTTGSSEACMLAGMALKRRWAARQPPGSAGRPNLVMGINVQVCWEKFCNYWEVEPRLVPMDGDRLHLSVDEAVARCDENTIGVVAVLGSTFDGSYEPVADIAAGLDAVQQRTGWDIPLHVDGASGAMVAPFLTHDLADLLLADLRRLLPELRAQPGPLRPARDGAGFHH